MKAWKQAALAKALEQLAEIEDAGHTVERCTDFHWKIDGMDVWPSAKKYMKQGVVTKYDNLQEIFN